MGFLKDFKNTVNNAKEMQAVGQQMQQEHQADLARAAEADPDDPDFAPIEGISLDQYATITAGIIKNAVAGIEAVAAFAESNGVAPGRWEQVNASWTSRMAQSNAVRQRYGMAYQQAMAG